MDKNIEAMQKLIHEVFENIPSKEKFEKLLLDLLVEKNKVIQENEVELTEDSKKQINEMDKVIESIQNYLSLVSK